MGHAGVTGRPTSTGEMGEQSPAQGTCDGMRMDLDVTNDRESYASSYSRYDQHCMHRKQGTGPSDRVKKGGYGAEEHQQTDAMRMVPVDPSKDLIESIPDLKVGTRRAQHPVGPGRNQGTAKSCVTSMHDEIEARPRVAGANTRRVTGTSDTVVGRSGPTQSDHLCRTRGQEGKRLKCTEWLADWTGVDGAARQSPILDLGESPRDGEEEEDWNVVQLQRLGKKGKKMETSEG